MPLGLVPAYFDQLPLNDYDSSGHYKTVFSADSLEIATANTVIAERNGNYPIGVRSQPQGFPISIEINIVNVEEDADRETYWDEVLNAFSLTSIQHILPSHPFVHTLSALSRDGNDVWTAQVFIERVASAMKGQQFQILLKMLTPWTNADTESETHDFTSDGETYTYESTTVEPSLPRIHIYPLTPKTSDVTYTKRRRVFATNRSEIGSLDDPQGDGYPIRLLSGEISSPGDDVRVVLKSRELNRWISGDNLWGNFKYQIGRKVTLAASTDDSSYDYIPVNEVLADEDWPYSGFIIFPSTGEIIYFIENADRAINPVTRGYYGSPQVAHAAGEAAYLIEHGPFLDIIYGYDTPGAPPFPNEKEPCIDMASSTNVLHISDEPHINLPTETRSRAWQPDVIDDGKSSQLLRQFNATGQLITEDQLPEAGKPKANDASLNFPVPIKAGVGTVKMNVQVDPAMLLLGLVEDIEGNESRLMTQFHVSGTASENLSPQDFLHRFSLRSRLAAICGDLSNAGFLLYPTTPASFDVTTEILDSLHTAPNVIILVPSPITLQVHFWLHFSLEQETEIDGFILYNGGGGGLAGVIYTGNAEKPTDQILYNIIFAPGLSFAQLNAPAGLPAGDYWMRFETGGIIGIHNERTEPTQYLGYHAFDDDIRALGTNEDAFNAIASIPNLNSNRFDFSPIFAVVSRTTDLQSDAPQQTAEQIKVSDTNFTLDDARAPFIDVGDEEDLYLMDLTITDQKQQSFSIYLPMAMDEHVLIDCEAKRVSLVTSLGDRLDVPFAFNGKWLQIERGALNSIQVNEPGLQGVRVVLEYPRRRV